MYVCVYVYIYIYIYVCMCVCVYIYIYTHTYTYVHTDISIYIYIYIHVYIYSLTPALLSDAPFSHHMTGAASLSPPAYKHPMIESGTRWVDTSHSQHQRVRTRRRYARSTSSHHPGLQQNRKAGTEPAARPHTQAKKTCADARAHTHTTCRDTGNAPVSRC